MKKTKNKFAFLVICALVCAFAFFSCSSPNAQRMNESVKQENNIPPSAQGGNAGADKPLASTQNQDNIPPTTSAGTTTTEQDIEDMDFSFTDRDEKDSYTTCTKITLADVGSTIVGKGAKISENNVVIVDEGTYLVSGCVTNSSLVVSAEKTDKIQLVFDGVSINNQNGEAVYIQSADKVFITLNEGTENYLSDGSSYSHTDGDTEIDAALFSKEDLTINGKGKLTVNGNCKHAMASSDDLVITGGVLVINSKNVGLKGKDCVKINDADITVTAGSDAIRSDNDEDNGRGYVYIESGNLTLTAQNDGIQAQTLLRLDGGNINITSGGGSKNSSTSTHGNAPNPSWGMWGGGFDSAGSSTDAESAKALKSSSYVIINGGNITIDSSDDSIHANGNVEINEGNITLSSGDDGIHADTLCTINGGNITVKKSYEGIEGSEIVINGGKIDITASDDGLNAAGGNDSSGLGGRPGMGGFTSGIGKIEINGGYILIDASGDGIDSNNTLNVGGGVTLVSGPTNSGNSAFDHDGSAHVSGGTLIALGTSSMAQSFNTADGQGAILVTFSTKSANTSIAVCDEKGNVIASFTPKKSYNCAVVTSPAIQQGKSYTFYANSTVANADENGYAENSTLTGGSELFSVTMSSLLYGSSSGMNGGGMNGGGGMRPR